MLRFTEPDDADGHDTSKRCALRFIGVTSDFGRKIARMKYINQPERQRVLAQALQATTLLELESATHAMDAWVAAHPDDIGIQDAYEQMALMELAARETTLPAREVCAPPVLSH